MFGNVTVIKRGSYGEKVVLSEKNMVVDSGRDHIANFMASNSAPSSVSSTISYFDASNMGIGAITLGPALDSFKNRNARYYPPNVENNNTSGVAYSPLPSLGNWNFSGYGTPLTHRDFPPSEGFSRREFSFLKNGTFEHRIYNNYIAENVTECVQLGLISLPGWDRDSPVDSSPSAGEFFNDSSQGAVYVTSNLSSVHLRASSTDLASKGRAGISQTIRVPKDKRHTPFSISESDSDQISYAILSFKCKRGTYAEGLLVSLENNEKGLFFSFQDSDGDFGGGWDKKGSSFLAAPSSVDTWEYFSTPINIPQDFYEDGDFMATLSFRAAGKTAPYTGMAEYELADVVLGTVPGFVFGNVNPSSTVSVGSNGTLYNFDFSGNNSVAELRNVFIKSFQLEPYLFDKRHSIAITYKNETGNPPKCSLGCKSILPRGNDDLYYNQVDDTGMREFRWETSDWAVCHNSTTKFETFELYKGNWPVPNPPDSVLLKDRCLSVGVWGKENEPKYVRTPLFSWDEPEYVIDFSKIKGTCYVRRRFDANTLPEEEVVYRLSFKYKPVALTGNFYKNPSIRLSHGDKFYSWDAGVWTTLDQALLDGHTEDSFYEAISGDLSNGSLGSFDISKNPDSDGFISFAKTVSVEDIAVHDGDRAVDVSFEVPENSSNRVFLKEFAFKGLKPLGNKKYTKGVGGANCWEYDFKGAWREQDGAVSFSEFEGEYEKALTLPDSEGSWITEVVSFSNMGVMGVKSFVDFFFRIHGNQGGFSLSSVDLHDAALLMHSDYDQEDYFEKTTSEFYNHSLGWGFNDGWVISTISNEKGYTKWNAKLDSAQGLSLELNPTEPLNDTNLFINSDFSDVHPDAQENPFPTHWHANRDSSHDGSSTVYPENTVGPASSSWFSLSSTGGEDGESNAILMNVGDGTAFTTECHLSQTTRDTLPNSKAFLLLIRAKEESDSSAYLLWENAPTYGMRGLPKWDSSVYAYTDTLSPSWTTLSSINWGGLNGRALVKKANDGVTYVIDSVSAVEATLGDTDLYLTYNTTSKKLRMFDAEKFALSFEHYAQGDLEDIQICVSYKSPSGWEHNWDGSSWVQDKKLRPVSVGINSSDGTPLYAEDLVKSIQKAINVDIDYPIRFAIKLKGHDLRGPSAVSHDAQQHLIKVDNFRVFDENNQTNDYYPVFPNPEDTTLQPTLYDVFEKGHFENSIEFSGTSEYYTNISKGAYLPGSGLEIPEGTVSGTLNKRSVIDSNGFIYENPSERGSYSVDPADGACASGFAVVGTNGVDSGTDASSTGKVTYQLLLERDDWEFLDNYYGGVGSMGLWVFDGESTFAKKGTPFLSVQNGTPYNTSLYNVTETNMNPDFKLFAKKVFFPGGLQLSPSDDSLLIEWEIQF